VTISLLALGNGLAEAGALPFDMLKLKPELISLCNAGNEDAIIPIPTSKIDQSTTYPTLSSLISIAKKK
jgi:hypothetical protein